MQTNRNNKMEKHVLFKVKTKRKSNIMHIFPYMHTKIYFSVFLCLCSLVFLFQFTSAWTDECQTLKSWHPPTTNLWYIALVFECLPPQTLFCFPKILAYMPAGFINLVESLSMTAPEHVQGIFWWTAGVYHQLYSLIMMHTRLLKVYTIAACLLF